VAHPSITAGPAGYWGSFTGTPQKTIRSESLLIQTIMLCAPAGLVPEDIEVTLKDNQRLTETVCFAHVDDLLRYSDPRAAGIIRDYPTALTDWLAKIDESQKERKEKRTKRKNSTSVDPSAEAGTEPQKEAKKVDIRGLYFHEVGRLGRVQRKRAQRGITGAGLRGQITHARTIEN